MRARMRDPEGFWGEAAQAIDWYEPRQKGLRQEPGVYGRWFTGASCNTCYNAIDRHVERGRANQTAIIYDSPVTSTKRVITYAELLREVADARRGPAGFRRRARATASSSTCRWCRKRCSRMHACARIGAIHSVVFGGFAAKELATRIDDCKPKLILSACCGIERAASSPTSRCSMRRSSLPSTSPRPA